MNHPVAVCDNHPGGSRQAPSRFLLHIQILAAAAVFCEVTTQ